VFVLPAGEVGVVTFHEWMPIPWDSRVIRGLKGKLSIVSAADLLGHDVNSRDSNWAVIIEGPSTRFVALGCQVRAVVLTDVEIRNNEYADMP
jgi:hypothetical protein